MIKLINETKEAVISCQFEETDLLETIVRIRDFLIASGYHPESVAQYLGLEDTCYAWYDSDNNINDDYDVDFE